MKRRAISAILSGMLLTSVFPANPASAVYLPPGVTNGYDGQGDLGTVPGKVHLDGYYQPGSIVTYNETDGNGISGGDPLRWDHDSIRNYVNYTIGRVIWPDGSEGRTFLYNLTTQTRDNGYMLLADQNMSDWVTALNGNQRYVSENVPISSMSNRNGSWPVRLLYQVVAASGATINYIGGNSSQAFLVDPSGTTASPAYKVLPTPAPHTSISGVAPSYKVGDTVNIGLNSTVYAANTNWHDVAVRITRLSDYVTWYPKILETGTNALSLDFFDYMGVVPISGGGSGAADYGKIYTDHATFDTTGLTPDTYKVEFAGYDHVGRLSQDGILSTTFTLLPAGGGGATTTDTLTGQVLDPAPTGVIKADNRGAEKFDVLKGIPTSETLYGNVIGKQYLYKYTFQRQKGTKQIPATVTRTYNLSWTDSKYVTSSASQSGTLACSQTSTSTIPASISYNQDGYSGTLTQTSYSYSSTPCSDPSGESGTWSFSRYATYGGTVTKHSSSTQTVTYHVTVNRDYSWWEAPEFEVYQLESATLSNAALPNGAITLLPSGYNAPTAAAQHTSGYAAHATDPPANFTMPAQTVSSSSVPDEQAAAQAYAEANMQQIKVKNDRVIFNGAVIMNDQQADKEAPTPSSVPAPSMIGSDTLYANHQVIDALKPNQVNASSGQITYKQVGGAQKLRYPIPNVNPVTVHTPTVCYPSVSDDQQNNQLTNPDYTRAAWILNEPMTVILPTSGAHQSYPGYGSRDYSKYIRERDVRFPFDVYLSGTYYPKNTWIQIPSGQQSLNLYLPVWVDEGNYDVEFRSIAINAPSDDVPAQASANLNLSNYVATKTMPVQVIGRLFDFRITDIADYNWERVFRTQKGSAIPTGNVYWVGDKDLDGNPRGNSSPFFLPIRPGSNPQQGYQYVSVKTGYHFKFDVKTIGNMFGLNDGIRITPSFYFVKKDGTGRIPVDLYYRREDNPFVKVGSAEDTQLRYVKLNTRLRNVPQQELIDTAYFNYDKLLTPEQRAMYGSRDAYTTEFMRKSSKGALVGSAYSREILPPALRTFIGNDKVPAGVDPQRANASVQKWYGEFSLPAAPFIVPKETNIAEYGRTHVLTDKSQIFLRDGYIVVNFNIETLHNQDVSLAPRLQYINGPLTNQWSKEGYKRSFTDPDGHTFKLADGDLVFYQADSSSHEDFTVGVTH